MKRILKRVGVVTIVLLFSIAVLAWLILSFVLIRPSSYQPDSIITVDLLDWEEHDKIYQASEFPWIQSYAPEGKGALEYVGALHTSDAQHPQLSEIESRWKDFKPTVAFCEGRKRMYRFASRNESGTLSESDLVRILAYRDGVELYTLEPTYEEEVAGLLKHFDPTMVAAYMTIRVYSAEAKGVPKNQQDGLAFGLLKKRTNVEGLAGSLNSVEALDEFWKKTFPDAKNWRVLSSPDQVPQLRHVGDVSREVRGRHMVSCLVDLVNKGERVFAVVGASHVIRQHRAIQQLVIGTNQ